MIRIFRYGINKTYTIYNILLGVKIANGSLIHYRSDFRCHRNISIGSKTVLYKKLSIYMGKKGRFSIGNKSHIAPYAYFLIENQTLTIGNDVGIGLFCAFYCSSAIFSNDEPPFMNNLDQRDIKIGNNVVIGTHSIILPGTEIADNVFVAANSLVKGKLESGWLYGGSPCKPIKKLDKND